MARTADSPRGKNALASPNRVADAEDLVEVPQLSDLDRALIESLREDGRQGSRALAKQLNVNEVTVAARLRRLEDADVIRVVAITDIRLFGHREFAFAMVQVSGRSVHDVAADLAKLPETVAVTLTTGRFDIIMPLLCRDRRHVAELFGTVLPAIDGIEHTPQVRFTAFVPRQQPRSPQRSATDGINCPWVSAKINDRTSRQEPVSLGTISKIANVGFRFAI